MESPKNIESELFMNKIYSKDVINQLNVVMRENENSEEIGVNFTIDKGVVCVGVNEEDDINVNWCGGSCEYEYAINYRDWTEEEFFIISENVNICFFGKSKGDINYYNRKNKIWEYVGNIENIYIMCNDKKKKGEIATIKVEEEISTEEKVYKIFFPENEIILNMNKLQYDFCIKLYEETTLFEDNFIDLQDITEITM